MSIEHLLNSSPAKHSWSVVSIRKKGGGELFESASAAQTDGTKTIKSVERKNLMVEILCLDDGMVLLDPTRF